jgi:integration host factor subunit alpha
MTESLTKNHIIDLIYRDCSYSRREVCLIFETFLGIIKDTLESGEYVLISGFGKFSVMKKEERKGRNPATAESLTLPSRKIVRFKCASGLRNKLNKKSV